MDTQKRQKFQGNWTCSGCGAAITELPFEPRNTDNLMCYDCHGKRLGAERGDRPARRNDQTFEGNWNCSSCGASINKLPFQPRDTSNLKCLGCFKQNRG